MASPVFVACPLIKAMLVSRSAVTGVTEKIRVRLFPLNVMRCPPASSATSFASSAAVNLRAFLRATPFQLRVWRALLRVPPGALVSYGDLAASLGHPRAARAVGAAVAGNTLAFLIPCHRVIRETGVTAGYRWGRERKRVMLGWEQARTA